MPLSFFPAVFPARWANAASFIAIAYCAVVILFGPPWDKGGLLGVLMPSFIFAPAIVTLMLASSNEGTMASKALSTPVALSAGAISYSVYLLQDIVFIALDRAFEGHPLLKAFAQPVAMMLLTTALGYGVYHLYEAPARRWIRSLASPNRVPAHQPPA